MCATAALPFLSYSHSAAPLSHIIIIWLGPWCAVLLNGMAALGDRVNARRRDRVRPDATRRPCRKWAGGPRTPRWGVCWCRREGQAWACQAAHPPAKKHALCDRTPPRWALAAALGAMPLSCAAVRPAHSRRFPSPSERTASVWRLRVAAGPAIGDMGACVGPRAVSLSIGPRPPSLPCILQYIPTTTHGSSREDHTLPARRILRGRS